MGHETPRKRLILVRLAGIEPTTLGCGGPNTSGQRTFESIRKRLSKKLASNAAEPRKVKTLISAPADEHLRHILGAKGNTTAKKRAAVPTRHTSTSEQFGLYGADLRARLQSRKTGTLCEALSMLTGLYPRGVMGLALADEPLAGEVLVLDVNGGFLHVTLSAILKRKTPRQHLPNIYEPTQDHYRVPLPLEVVEPLRDLLANCHTEPTGPDFRLRLIDILPLPDRDHQTANGVSAIESSDAFAPGFAPTAARTRNTVANEAVAAKRQVGIWLDVQLATSPGRSRYAICKVLSIGKDELALSGSSP